MKIDLRSLKDEVNYLELEESPSTSGGLKLEAGGVEFLYPVKLNLKLLKSGKNYIGKGEIETKINIECSRCLKKFTQNLKSEIGFLLKEEKDPFVGFGFTHNTSNFNEGVVCSSYKTLATMQDKVRHQMGLVEKLRSADTSDTARLILERHFIKDMKGNLRNFSIQNFRCVSCNEIFRRPPLSGVCLACGGKLIFTVHEGGIKKYLELALELVEKYHLSNYMKQNLDLLKRFVDSIFGKELDKQKALNDWFG